MKRQQKPCSLLLAHIKNRTNPTYQIENLLVRLWCFSSVRIMVMAVMYILIILSAERRISLCILTSLIYITLQNVFSCGVEVACYIVTLLAWIKGKGCFSVCNCVILQHQTDGVRWGRHSCQQRLQSEMSVPVLLTTYSFLININNYFLPTTPLKLCFC